MKWQVTAKQDIRTESLSGTIVLKKGESIIIDNGYNNGGYPNEEEIKKALLLRTGLELHWNPVRYGYIEFKRM